jgi:uncharacterized protein YheU (UPF0270 family)
MHANNRVRSRNADNFIKKFLRFEGVNFGDITLRTLLAKVSFHLPEMEKGEAVAFQGFSLSVRGHMSYSYARTKNKRCTDI